jgi:hypothetical protein
MKEPHSHVASSLLVAFGFIGCAGSGAQNPTDLREAAGAWACMPVVVETHPWWPSGGPRSSENGRSNQLVGLTNCAAQLLEDELRRRGYHLTDEIDLGEFIANEAAIRLNVAVRPSNDGGAELELSVITAQGTECRFTGDETCPRTTSSWALGTQLSARDIARAFELLKTSKVLAYTAAHWQCQREAGPVATANVDTTDWCRDAVISTGHSSIKSSGSGTPMFFATSRGSSP